MQQIKFGKNNIKKFLLWAGILSSLSYILLHLTGTACYFKAIYGIPCPGCGIIRAGYYLIKLEFRKSFYYHPLLFLAIFVLIVLLGRRNRFLSKIYNSHLFWNSVSVIFILTWIIRLFIYFPHHVPMDFNKSSLLFKIFKLLSKEIFK